MGSRSEKSIDELQNPNDDRISHDNDSGDWCTIRANETPSKTEMSHHFNKMKFSSKILEEYNVIDFEIKHNLHANGS